MEHVYTLSFHIDYSGGVVGVYRDREDAIRHAEEHLSQADPWDDTYYTVEKWPFSDGEDEPWYGTTVLLLPSRRNQHLHRGDAEGGLPPSDPEDGAATADPVWLEPEDWQEPEEQAK